MEKTDSRPETWEHIHQVQQLLVAFATDILRRAMEHDQTKLKFPELELFDEYTAKLKQFTYNSPEYMASLAALKPALDHHYARNTHHPEHYPEGINDMNLLDLLEMMADWKAASLRQLNGNILKSLEANKKRFGIDAQLSQILENTVKKFGW